MPTAKPSKSNSTGKLKSRAFRNQRLTFVIALLACAMVTVYVAGTHAEAARLFSKFFADRNQPSLSFAERVTYQRAIEEVYWRHRLWPAENSGAKPTLEQVMPTAEIENKVEDYLRNSQALDEYRQNPITAGQLQDEMDRMARDTKQPDVLREIFAALGDDPFVIAECLARPTLAERLVTNLYAHDERLYGELRSRAHADLLAHNTVGQMKNSSGVYGEVDLLRAGNDRTDRNRDAGKSIRMNSTEWEASLRKLAAEFSSADESLWVEPNGTAEAALSQIKTGVLSPLQEDDNRFYATAVLSKSTDSLRVATIQWVKEPFESWRARTIDQTTLASPTTWAAYTLPAILAASVPLATCTSDTWTATSLTSVPAQRTFHTAVWTGSEMFVWGGRNILGYLNDGGKYNPTTNSWTATSTTNAPAARTFPSAIWTGTEVIVWGGFFHDVNTFTDTYFNSGGKYNPGTNSWTATSLTNAPSGRYGHTVVWTGSEMIVWGGGDAVNYLNTGARYNPGANSWTTTNPTNAPATRWFHTAVWTGSQMIVWGGGNNAHLNTGGRYSPGTDSWTATGPTNAPTARSSLTAVWTGTEMIIWGGTDDQNSFNTGARYSPGTDSWTATTIANAPAGRSIHTAIWTGSEMIIWGGGDNVHTGNAFNTGGRYNPGTDSWTATSTTNAPQARSTHTAVWTGSEMIVWGGEQNFDLANPLNNGGRYCAPSSGSPTPTPTPTPTATPTPTPTPAPNTPVGSNVTAQTTDASVTFPTVSQAGTTTFTAISPASAGTPPGGYTLCATCPAYDITTTASFTPPVTVCLGVPASIDQQTFNTLALLHKEGSALVDRTTNRITNPDSTRKVCGSVSSLSPFALAQGPTATPTPTPTPSPTPSNCTPLSDGFDNLPNVPGWFLQNNSQPLGTTGWSQGSTTTFNAQSGAAGSYIAANFNNTASTGGTISNWFVTQPLILQNGALLTFYTRTADPAQFADRLQIRLSSNGSSTNVGTTATGVGDFATLLLDINPNYSTTGYPVAWTQYSVRINGLKTATTGRLAFRYFVENGGLNGTHSNYIGIDTVQFSCAPAGNAIDISDFFVTQHYFDFLGRQPDPAGLAFWNSQITNCVANQGCIDASRVSVSASFFLSIEFQQTGYLVERIYKSAYGDVNGTSTFPSAHQLPVPVIRFSEFLSDTQEIGQGLVVGQTGWEAVLENNKQAFVNEFVQRSRFATALPTTMTPAQFVDKLFLNAGVTPTASDRTAAINEFGAATTTTDTAARGRALRRVAENSTLNTQEFNRAFVLMQYYGYLRRDPNGGQDTDWSGYDFWLTKLNQFNGNFINAEMVKAFITSIEYRQRFAP